tara:strand:- start:64 stop:837 length:774 start_codon:yes stop_codon:yes gene_type:complete
MVGNIYLRDAAGGNTNVGVTTFANITANNINGNVDINVGSGEADIYSTGSGDQLSLRLLNSDTTSGNKIGIYFGPCNNVAGAYIKGVAEADFTSTANRDAGLEFGTRLNGSFLAPLKISAAGYVQSPINPYFRAYNSSSTDRNGTVIWDSTQNNNGNVYDTSTGVFTAPIAGFYWFAFTVKGRAVGNTVYARAEKSTNGGSSYSGIGPALEFHNDILSAHTTASFGEHLNASDKVRIGSGSNVRVDGSNGFSGFLAG